MFDWHAIRQQYRTLIESDFWPYWEQHDDPQYGGVLNCISNDGGTRISDDKFTWSQGRYLWMLAELLELTEKGLVDLAKDRLRSSLDRCQDFILQHAIGPEAKVYYLLDRRGEPKPEPRTGRLDASIFSDSFIVIGLANAARVTLDDAALPVLRTLYHSIVSRIRSGTFLTEPYPIPEGYRSHSIPMILLNTSVEYGKAFETLQPDNTDEIEFSHQIAGDCAREIHEVFYDSATGLMREYVSTPSNYETKLQDRHVNPGHTIEDCWFLLEYHKRNGTESEALEWVEPLAQKSWQIGWDPEHGGLLRFVDKAGGAPKGDVGEDPFELLVADTWGMKLWWPHSETLYTFLKLYQLSGSELNREIYETSAEYIFSVFPDPVHGEWIQIRDRSGAPEEKLVALPVKDPFHIVRNFCRILELEAL